MTLFSSLSLFIVVCTRRTVLWYRFVPFHMSALKCILQIPLKRNSTEIECRTEKQNKVNFDCSLFFTVKFYSLSIVFSSKHCTFYSLLFDRLLTWPRKKAREEIRPQPIQWIWCFGMRCSLSLSLSFFLSHCVVFTVGGNFL